jgi:hypothetical protein
MTGPGESEARRQTFERIQEMIASDAQLRDALQRETDAALERAGLTEELRRLRSEGSGKVCACSLLGVTCWWGASCVVTIVAYER